MEVSGAVFSRLRRIHSPTTRTRGRPGPAPAPERSPDALPLSVTPLSRRAFRADCVHGEHGSRVSPVGEFDGSAVVAFERAMAVAIALRAPIVIDLGGLSFIDSSGLWALTTTHTACRKLGIPLQLRPGPENVQEVLEVTGLYDLLPFAAPRR